jgi:DNA-binding NarL/FixJ family response regulator
MKYCFPLNSHASLFCFEEKNMLRVLLVEDNDMFREAFKKRLQDDFSFMVIEQAASGDEALQKIGETPPQLIFMDIRLPGFNGLQLTQKVKKEFPGIKIAVLTSYDLPEYRQAATEYGADRFFVKSSFKWDELETLVKSITPGVS